MLFILLLSISHTNGIDYQTNKSVLQLSGLLLPSYV